MASGVRKIPGVGETLSAAVAALGGAERVGQVTMAEAVADAMEAGEHLLVQAGTGTGKSLAYLVPALLHAARGDGPVVVATATLALQAQIVDRDLPRLAHAVSPLLGRKPTFAILKGRSNYVCKAKLSGAVPDDDASALFSTPSTPLGKDVQRAREWAGETDSGDRDELVPGVSQRAWRQVSVTSRECVGAQKCAFGQECFAELARARAAEADIVVTNHALLAIDALESFQVLPEHDVVVVDEAHELVDRVTGVATAELTASMVERAGSRALKLVDDEAADLQESATELARALDDLPPGRLPSPLPAALTDALITMMDAARATQSALGRVKDADEGDKKAARAAVDAAYEVADRLLTGSQWDVAWVTVSERGPAVARSLHVAPLSVAGLLRDRLFGERTVVCTSATLELGGSFDLVARSLGLGVITIDGEDVAGSAYSSLDVGTPFDAARQGILYVASRLPQPGREAMAPQVLDELAALVEAAGGRTLGLFSSMRAAQEAAYAMRQRLDVPIMLQGEDTTAELVRQFASTASSCLFGTMSLWQGVDVPGSALQLVVMDRIPFPRPDDPLMAARKDAAGPAGFQTVYTAHAALRMAQGAGRLLRAVTDRGVVAILDPRLTTKPYGRFLRESLPPFWMTTNRETVLEALRRIDKDAPPIVPVRVPPPRAGAVAVASG
ncbi:ATP-dependent DNA helicase [Motilibacter aurantiacus]|uniref:ATP-dependent DNA helicase n=1 Tax=Motilibacter aurantiacus TaxID=2714955 RepID=UPI00140D1CA4|nr:ATP-dependent DNA helicase [Motilibacter aurantiacus]NHC44527.1 ATP-dependent DNA helicase [Motilibacter aurantiacus]